MSLLPSRLDIFLFDTTLHVPYVWISIIAPFDPLFTHEKSVFEILSWSLDLTASVSTGPSTLSNLDELWNVTSWMSNDMLAIMPKRFALRYPKDIELC